jgi:trk system potassium uptake protein TrkA
MVEEAVTVGDLVRLIRLGGGQVSIVEMTLPEGSPSVGRAVYELRLPADAVIVAVLREGHVVIPQPETVLAAGDEVLALASGAVERALRDAVVGEDMPGGVPSDTLDGTAGVE